MRIPGVTGAEVVHPYEVDTVEAMQSCLRRLQLGIAAVNVNIKADPAFACGSLCSPDPAIRRKACDMIMAAKDYAKALGADKVTCCPLSDGYDYPFQTDYRKAWNRMVDVVREAAAYLPEVPLSWNTSRRKRARIAPSIPRPKALLLCDAVGDPNLGVTIDFGHRSRRRDPAEALALVAASGFPYYVHINDNNGKWELDLMAGTCNLWLYVEFRTT